MDEGKEKPRRGWGPPIAGLIVAVTALSLDTLSPITRRLPIHWVPVLGAAGGLMLACWPWAWRLLRRTGSRGIRWTAAVLALLPLVFAGGYLLWTPALLGVVPVPPMAFSSGGLNHLAYEIRLKHYGFRELRLTQVRVLDQDGRRLGSFDAEWLVNGPLQSPDGPAASLTLDAGRDTTLFLWLALEKGRSLPDRLDHELLLTDAQSADSGREASRRPSPAPASDNPVRIDQDGTLVIAGPSTLLRLRPRTPVMQAPLRGGPWLARAGPSNWSRHRRARILGHISQRFALDWVRIDAQGRTWRQAEAANGRPVNNGDFLAWGEEVRAAFSGTVAAVRDGSSDHPPGGPREPVTLSNFAGNYVVIRHDDGYCALYGHLQWGSVTVRPGQRVFSRRLLGKIGNSGNSDEPHLHFQVADGCDLLRSEGLPFHLESYRSHGFLTEKGAFTLPWPGDPVQYAMPLRNQIVTFPDD
ncbi:MAG TPA: M23 family metallopeptidase [Acidobacteriota bacterium]|nr:M23 family metallopeptidase [Acidobacteriota bacterium]